MLSTSITRRARPVRPGSESSGYLPSRRLLRARKELPSDNAPVGKSPMSRLGGSVTANELLQRFLESSKQPTERHLRPRRSEGIRASESLQLTFWGHPRSARDAPSRPLLEESGRGLSLRKPPAKGTGWRRGWRRGRPPHRLCMWREVGKFSGLEPARKAATQSYGCPR